MARKFSNHTSKYQQRRQKLTVPQQARLKKLTVLLVVLGVLWLIFAPGSGLLSIMGQRAELRELEARTATLVEKNRELEKEIERLENDSEYLEEIARKDYGLLKKNEKVYDFSRPEKNSE